MCHLEVNVAWPWGCVGQSQRGGAEGGEGGVEVAPKENRAVTSDLRLLAPAQHWAWAGLTRQQSHGDPGEGVQGLVPPQATVS